MPRPRAAPAAPRRAPTRLRPPTRLLASESPTPSPSLMSTTLDPDNASFVSSPVFDEEDSMSEILHHRGPNMTSRESSESIGYEDLKEIGNLASWTVSTAKPGCGVEQLRDEDTNLFWQSDGPQPHTISIHFARRVFVRKIQIYLDHVLDESYTPTKISISSGTGYHDLQEVTVLQLDCPRGWIEVPLDDCGPDGILKTFLIEVKIHANHLNGKDTHVRGLQIFSALSGSQAVEVPLTREEAGFTTTSLLSELEIR